MYKIRIVVITLIGLILLSSCAKIKEGLSGRKSNNSDEFLVKKKSPLVLPPDFNKLPKPNSETLDNESEQETNIQDLIMSSKKKKIKKTSKNQSVEEFILKQIKQD